MPANLLSELVSGRAVYRRSRFQTLRAMLSPIYFFRCLFLFFFFLNDISVSHFSEIFCWKDYYILAKQVLIREDDQKVIAISMQIRVIQSVKFNIYWHGNSSKAWPVNYLAALSVWRK